MKSFTSSVTAVILAAGKGTRMQAPPDKNKVTFAVKGKPLVWHTLQNLRSAGFQQIITVVGYAAASVKAALGPGVEYVTQTQQLGTGHALKCALPSVHPSSNTLITMYGDDSAFYPPQLFRDVIKSHQDSNADLTVLTVKVQNQAGLGRIIRDANQQVTAIVEEKNASTEQKTINEINTGLFCFKLEFIKKAVESLTKNEVSGEYYLTDTLAFAVSGGFKVNALCWPDSSVWHGVNTPQELALAQHKAKKPLSS